MSTQVATKKGGKEMKTFTREEVGKHASEDDLWIVVDNVVYDLSDFMDMHPGGAVVLTDPAVAGKDATEVFYQLHRQEVLEKYKRYIIGTIENQKPSIIVRKSGDLSPVPYGEPTWLSPAYHSPYYSDSHRQFQKAMRKLFDEEIIPEAGLHEETGERPSDELLHMLAEKNMHYLRLGPGKHLKGLKLIGDVKPEEYDYFHELILNQELSKMAARGFADGFLGGMVIGLPPVLNFGSKELIARIAPDIFATKKFICLAISEAFAGSDVSGIRTTAVDKGDHYIVNGTKKWITNGVFSDYFSTVAKSSNGGLVMLLIERSFGGVETKPIKTTYSPAAGTAYVTFTDVKVPKGNILGKDGKGLYVVLSNFNHERWVMTGACIAGMRGITEECMKWANQRKVFGKPLISQPVIRQKLAKMFATCEMYQSWIENITYQMTKMSYAEQSQHLAGQISLVKASATKAAGELASEAVQIFGGRAITKTGMGKKIEMYHRTYKFDSILGGSEEILNDLGVRQAMRQMPKIML